MPAYRAPHHKQSQVGKALVRPNKPWSKDFVARHKLSKRKQIKLYLIASWELSPPPTEEDSLSILITPLKRSQKFYNSRKSNAVSTVVAGAPGVFLRHFVNAFLEEDIWRTDRKYFCGMSGWSRNFIIIMMVALSLVATQSKNHIGKCQEFWNVFTYT